MESATLMNEAVVSDLVETLVKIGRDRSPIHISIIRCPEHQ